MKGKMQSANIEAVVWDLDGTLLDTEPLSTQAIQQVLDRYDKVLEWDLEKKVCVVQV